jgi:hypothetical protein
MNEVHIAFVWKRLKPMKVFTISILSIFLAVGILRAQTLQFATPIGVMLQSLANGTLPAEPNDPTQTGYGIDKIQLYPNPSSDVVYLSITFQQQEPVHLQLYNLLGQTVWSVNLDKTQRVETTIPVQQLANGVYLLQITAGNTIDERKIVVAK